MPAALRDSGLILSTGTRMTPYSVLTTTSVAVGDAGEMSPLITDPSLSLRTEGAAPAMPATTQPTNSSRENAFMTSLSIKLEPRRSRISLAERKALPCEEVKVTVEAAKYAH